MPPLNITPTWHGYDEKATVGRPLKDKSIAQLLHKLARQCRHGRRFTAHGYEYCGDCPSTFFAEPVSESAFAALQRVVRGPPYEFSDGLPEDYVEFLRLTDGFNGSWGNDWQYGFWPVDLLVPSCRDDAKDVLHETPFIREDLKFYLEELGVEFEWPRGIYPLNIGKGGIHGFMVMFPNAVTRLVADGLRKAHSDAKGADDRAAIEKLANLFVDGGIGNLDQAQSFVMRYWYPIGDAEMYSSFKHILEFMVVDMDRFIKNNPNRVIGEYDAEDYAVGEWKHRDDDEPEDAAKLYSESHAKKIRDWIKEVLIGKRESKGEVYGWHFDDNDLLGDEFPDENQEEKRKSSDRGRRGRRRGRGGRVGRQRG